MTQNKHDPLETFFQAGRDHAPNPSAGFMARLLDDADHMARAMPIAPPPRVSWIAEVWSTLGGWPSGLGLASALCIGVMFGVSPPDAVFDVTTAWLDMDAFDPLIDYTDIDLFLEEDA